MNTSPGEIILGETVKNILQYGHLPAIHNKFNIIILFVNTSLGEIKLGETVKNILQYGQLPTNTIVTSLQ